jgi:hypothetical protein
LTDEDLSLFSYLASGSGVKDVEYCAMQARDFNVEDFYLPTPSYNWDGVVNVVNSIDAQIEKLTGGKFGYRDLQGSNELNPFGQVYNLPDGRRVISSWAGLRVREMNDNGLGGQLVA